MDRIYPVSKCLHKKQGFNFKDPMKLSVAFRITSIYIVVGALWILLSDRWVESLAFNNTSITTLLQTAKGWGYILVTAVMLYTLVLFDFSALKKAQYTLEQGYDATLKGWARALDLRDRSTEKHTQRVAELTLNLATSIGIREPELTHLRRGALLHDIGKIGIPDRILLKPGALTDDEWRIMHQHPNHAYEMLSPIEYLQPALDIPYCHHEKWDGTGYPRGLKGEQIPLAARIFAVVDVWDALTSSRPYREAWTNEQTLDYIQAEAGKSFDPQVVQEFLKMVHTH
jgi:putative nucleotidyltransferase with HDIG domain